MVGVNPTRRGAELATDVRHTDCQLLVTERKLLPLLDGLDLGVARDRVLVIDTDEYAEECIRYRDASFPEEPVPPDAPALQKLATDSSPVKGFPAGDTIGKEAALAAENVKKKS